MAFNAKAHAEALVPPAFVDLAGRTHTGRILSIEEMVRLQQFVDTVNPIDGRTAADRMIRAWFPRRWWQFGHPALRAFRRLPETTQVAAIESFLVSQRNAMPSPSGTSRPTQPAA